ncbi:hypothetical protein SAMN02910369_02283 [Lachnospiraceae bacterium NE2001]|nr:hypothetical protein SAMN02910369_02283 [Lachnospiraceae bacterium NE2001]
MKTSVELQPPFAYMIIWIILSVVVIAAVIFAQVYLRKKLGERLKKEKKLKMKRISEATLEGKKKKYLAELSYIETDLVNNKITIRESYQKISHTIRMFVFEVTGIKVQHYTLTEIRRVNIPQLTNLVREYYEPEFARETRADVRASIFRTRALIEGWRK